MVVDVAIVNLGLCSLVELGIDIVNKIDVFISSNAKQNKGELM